MSFELCFQPYLSCLDGDDGFQGPHLFACCSIFQKVDGLLYKLDMAMDRLEQELEQSMLRREKGGKGHSDKMDAEARAKVNG